MAHFTDPRFWQCYTALPKQVRRLASKNFKLLKQSPQHPSLHFKKISDRDRLWSVRVGKGYRAAAIEVNGDFQWFWIGTHAAYDRLLR
jgi:mRNA-degrading endonuclease RelE of RelBE toxin-antitoxin system